MDDPLSALLEGTGGAAPAPVSAPASAADSVFRTLDVSKMKAPLPAKAGATSAARPAPASTPKEKDEERERQVVQQTTGSAKGLGFGVDLWGGSAASQGLDSLKSNRGGDLLSEASFPVADAGIFQQKTSSADGAPVPAPTSMAVKTVRVGSELDDYKLDDLKVSERLLERKEELDFATFGKASHAVQLKRMIATVQAGRDKGDLELESSDVLAKLEAATLEGEKSSAFRKSAAAAASADVPAPKVVDVDLATLDLDSYIKQQEEAGGGLFD